MARMIGRTGSWLWWAAGFLCAFVFGRGAAAGEAAMPEYGVRVRPPQPVAQPSDNLPKPAANLEDSAEWKQIASAWAEAEKLLASKWDGRTLVDRNQEPKKGVLDGIETARKNVDALLAAGLLSAGEVELLKQGLGALSGRVSEWAVPRPTCYAPMPPPPPPKKFEVERAAAQQLSARLPLLEKLAAQKRLQPAVVAKALAQFNALLSEANVPLLRDENLKGMPDEERERIVKTRDAAKAATERIKALLDDAGRPAPELGARIDALVKDLGAEDFAKREAASQELVKIGLPALSALRAAAGSRDAEVAARARAAMDAIKGRSPGRVDSAPLHVDNDEVRLKLQAVEEEIKRRQMLQMQQGGK